MFETQSASTFEASIEPTATSERSVLQPLAKPPSEVAVTSRKGSTNSHLPVWEPAEPQFTKAIADYYGVSRKSVQEWFQKVRQACPWFSESDLKLDDDRYTPIAVNLMGNYRTSKLLFKTWKARIWEENPDLVAAFQASQQDETVADSDRSRETVVYRRSADLSALLNACPQIGATETPEQNPLVLAFRQKVSSLENTTLTVRQQLDQVRQMTTDTREAIQALEDLEVVERAQAKADRHYQLEKQVYARRLETLGVEDVLGKSHVQDAQPRSA